jgi:hypothetical protein
MRPSLCIVSVYRPDLLDVARNALSLSQNIEVIMDRRVGERRGPDRAVWGSDRRQRSIDEDLRTQGYAFVGDD